MGFKSGYKSGGLFGALLYIICIFIGHDYFMGRCCIRCREDIKNER